MLLAGRRWWPVLRASAGLARIAGQSGHVLPAEIGYCADRHPPTELSPGEKETNVTKLTSANAGCLILGTLAAPPVFAQVPRYEQVLIAVMEKHGLTQIVGNSSVPMTGTVSMSGSAVGTR